MASIRGPFVANLFMEEFQTKAINTAINPQRLLLKYFDDSFIIQKTEHQAQFLECFNSLDPHIHFTTEDPNTDGSVPFSGTLAMPGPDNT